MEQRHVIDANVTLGLVLNLPYSPTVDRWMDDWKAEGAGFVVPTLWEYECISGLRRAVFLKIISGEQLERIAQRILAFEFQRVGPTPELHRAALTWAERIGQAKAYDAQYLALAESLGAEFWTADQKLYRAAERVGATWIHAV